MIYIYIVGKPKSIREHRMFHVKRPFRIQYNASQVEWFRSESDNVKYRKCLFYFFLLLIYISIQQHTYTRSKFCHYPLKFKRVYTQNNQFTKWTYAEIGSLQSIKTFFFSLSFNFQIILCLVFFSSSFMNCCTLEKTFFQTKYCIQYILEQCTIFKS